MKIAAISDIHGNRLALLAVLADIDREAVDLTINCGDTLSGPLEPARTADVLMARGIPMIAGNHERQVLTLPAERQEASDAFAAREISAEQRSWLASAPPTMWLADDVFVCHGTPRSDLTNWLETVTPDLGQHGSNGIRPATSAEVAERLGVGEPSQRASLILCGHTHTPRVVQHGGITIVNPGSVGLPGFEHHLPHPHRVENHGPHARYALIERQAAGWQVQLRSVPYDFEPMAALAERNGRPEWALPLRTGRMTASA